MTTIESLAREFAHETATTRVHLARPIVVVQGRGAACTIGLLVGLAGTAEAAGAVRSAAGWLATSVSTLVTYVPLGPDVVGYVLRGSILALGIWLALVPIAVYFATDD